MRAILFSWQIKEFETLDVYGKEEDLSLSSLSLALKQILPFCDGRGEENLGKVMW